jgi:regulator of sigma E protease
VPNILHIIEIAVALGLIIFVHELGHFLAAKYFGVWVRRFAIGFGPAIPGCTWRHGGPLPADGMPPADDPDRYATEYTLRWIPLGGFVEPMGDHPDSEGGSDPRALWRRPAWQRIVVFSAGVGMNAVLAVVFFTAAFMIGVNAPSPMVGAVSPLMAAEEAGIQAGDRIVAINDRPIESFEDIMTLVSSYDAGTSFDITVERPAAGDKPPERLTFKNLVSRREPGDMAPRLGIEPAAEPVIHEMIPGSPEQQAGLTAGDRILNVNGKPVWGWRQMSDLMDAQPVGPVTLEIERGGRREALKIVPSELKQLELGMGAPLSVRLVDPDGPAAKAGMHRGDRIVRVGEESWPSAEEFSSKVKSAGPDAVIKIMVERKGQTLEIEPRTAIYGGRPDPRIGIVMEAAVVAPVVIGWVEPSGAAAKAGLQPGDVIVAIGAKEIHPRSWEDVLAVAGSADFKPVPLQVERGGKTLTTSLTPVGKPMEKFAMLGSKPGAILYEPLPRLYNPLKAAARGLKRTWLWLGRVYNNLLQLSKGEVSTEALGGPVLIVSASLAIAAHGIGTFLDFWGILSVCIAVFNFLPIPPFDGGHVLFVLIEKIKGGPISVKVRTWIWGAGWAAVGVLFILIMWQDIARLMT